jgi:putative ABC transport system permease protein
MTTLLQLRFALRLLARNRIFALVAMATLGAGIGANTAIFSAVDAVLIHPLHYKDAEQLVLVTKNMPMFELEKSDASALDFLDYRNLSKSFSGIAAFDANSVNLTGDQEPMRVYGLRSSASLFPMLGVQPRLGRFFRPDEEQPGRNRVVVLGEDLWKTRFGADPQIVGRQIQLNAESFTVIGVVQPLLQFLEPSQVYVPLALTSEELDPHARGHQHLEVVARLRPDAALGRARAEMKVVAAQMTRHLPDWYPKGWSIDLDPLAESVAGEMRTPLVVLLAAVGIVLLIACANVANLLLARATSRQREIGIRTALGGERREIVSQLLTESILLAALAGAASGIDVNDALKASVGRVSGGHRGLRLRSFLIVSEIALSLVLLAGAGLLVRSFQRLESADPGFKTDRLLTARISLPVLQYRHGSDVAAFYSQLKARIAALPGVVSVGFIDGLPFGSGGGGGSFSIVGRPWAASEPEPDVRRRVASPDYFRTMRIPLKQGRTFTEQDAGDAPKVAVVDEVFAKTFFPKGDAIGRQITFKGSEPYQIVGVVGAVRDRNLVLPPRAIRYYPSLEAPVPFMNVVVRTTGDPLGIVSGIQAQVRELDRNLPVYKIASMEQLLADSLARRRLSMLLLAILAGFALLLSAVGIYGVVAYSVRQRTAEIGIRMALGAESGNVRRMVLRQALRPVLAGIALGLVAAAATTRVLSSLLYQVSATDPLTFLVVPCILLLAAVSAIYIPARRATRIDPTDALRYE